MALIYKQATNLGASQRPDALALPRPFELTCLALAVAHVAYLIASFVNGSWLVAPDGNGFATDFVNVWAAGRQTLDGNPAGAYDEAVHKEVAVAAVGRYFEGGYPWIYPPTFLFVAVLLALLPYVAAYAAWVFLTFPLYAVTVRMIVAHRSGFLLAIAYPGILANFIVGQNGFVTAALIGGALLLLERRPVLAGCLIGLLSFKPQFGILFPLVLIAGGYWRAFASAAVTTVSLAVAAWFAFGTSAWIAFFHALPNASQDALTQGLADWGKLQSVFGLVRVAGGGEQLAWTLQGAMVIAVVILLSVLWRSKLLFDLKAAALATGVLLATPYIFLYDLVVLAVPMAFLLRMGLARGFLPGEWFGLAAANLLILVFPLVKAPLGLVAVLIVALLIARRALLAAGMIQGGGKSETAPQPAP